jgi:hypothetical protein
MGSKGSSTPPPDPRLIEAQIRSMGVQDDAIQSVLANSAALAPLQRDQMQFALDASRQGFKQSQEDRDWMLTRRSMLSGVQDSMVQDAREFDRAQRTDELAAEAGADVNAAASSARQQSARAMARMGVMPGSGRAAAQDARMQLGQTAMLAGAKNNARRAARAEGYSLDDRANNALAGYPAMGMQATGAGAGLAASGVGIANAGLAGMNSGYGAAAGIAGQMGQNATSMFGAQASYKNAQDQLAAQSDPTNMLLGAAVGVGTSWATGGMSDRRLKTDIVAVGRDERTGLGLYEFAYLNGDGRRFRGVMADEVEQVDPKAVMYDDLGFARVDYGRLGIDMVEVA